MSKQAQEFKKYLEQYQDRIDPFEAVRVGRHVFELTTVDARLAYEEVVFDGPLDCIFSSSD